MSVMARYARIFWAEPTDADVGARNRSVATLCDQFRALKPREAITVGDALVGAFEGADLSLELSEIVETAISDQSEAFELKGNERQATVCAAVAALQLVRTAPLEGSGWSAADAMAAALWSGLALQDPLESAPVEALRGDLLESCRERARAVAKRARERQDVPDVGVLTIAETDPAGGKAQASYKRATAPVIKALKENADLDREEIDFLWWTLADHSAIFDSPLADKTVMNRAVAVGIEAGSMLRRLPTDGHRHVALRLIGESEALSLNELIAILAEDREPLGLGFTGSWVSGCPTVFPLLNALMANGKMRRSSVKLDARGWGARALLEAAIVRLEGGAGGTK